MFSSIRDDGTGVAVGSDDGERLPLGSSEPNSEEDSMHEIRIHGGGGQGAVTFAEHFCAAFNRALETAVVQATVLKIPEVEPVYAAPV